MLSVSRHGVSVEHGFFEWSKNSGSTGSSQVWTWEEKVQNFRYSSVQRLSGVRTNEPRVTNGSDNSGNLSLRDVCFGKPRVCAKDFHPKQCWFAQAGEEKEWKEGFSGGTPNNSKESPLCLDIRQKYEYSPENVRESNLQWGKNNFVFDGLIHCIFWIFWILAFVGAQKWISEQSPVRYRRTRSHHSMDTTRGKNQNFARDGEEFYESFQSRRRTSQKLFSWTIYQNLASLVKNYHGIIDQLHLIAFEFAERLVLRVKEGTSAVLLQSGLDEKWRSDAMKCCYFLQNAQNLLANGKSQYERRCGEPFQGPIIWRTFLISPKIRSKKPRIHQFGKEIISVFFDWLCFIRGGKLEKMIFWLLMLKNSKIWRHQKNSRD